jgi:cobalt-zinc-cadmium efflux system outer membrane protein
MQMRSSIARTVSATRLGLIITAVLALHVTAAIPARAVPPPPPALSRMSVTPDTIKIGWPDIVRLADQHPAPSVGRWGVAAARGAADAAGTLPNPSLDATLTRGETPEGLRDRLEWELGLTVPLGWIAQRGHLVRAASAQVDVSREEARAIRRDVLLELRSLFWNQAYEQARVAALDTLHEQTAELVRLVSRRVERGEARPAEATRVEIELEMVAGELDASRVTLGARRDQLKLWISGAGSREVVVEADFGDVPEVPDLEEALATARSRHPGLGASRARVRALVSEAGAERMARVPGIELRGFTARELERRTWGGGIALGLPLWDWNSGRIARAGAQLEAGRKRLEWETRQTESAVIEAHADCLATTRTAERYRDRILPRAESVAKIMEKTYRLGEAGLLELIDARRVLVETRLRYLATLVRAQLDCSRLSALAGQEDTP